MAPFVSAVLFVGIAVVLVAIIGVMQARFIARLQKYHQGVWRRLGEPFPLPGLSRNRYAASTMLGQYLRAREYEGLDDPETLRIATRLRTLRVGFLRYVLVVGPVVLVLLAITKG